MGIEIGHYAFALFVAGLVCLVAVLCKVLFADLKRQHKLLDEKETKLLQLYRTVEGIMEEFADQAKATSEEIKEYESRVAMRAASVTLPPDKVNSEPLMEKLPPAEKLPRSSVTVDSSRIRAASEVLERAERIIKSETLKAPAKPGQGGGTVFQSFFDETVGDPPATQRITNNKQHRNEKILALAAEGKTDAQIASELGITRNEVNLVIELNSTS